MLTYRDDLRPDIRAIRALYAAAPLRRPVGDPARIEKMFAASNVILSAWDGPRLVGLLRGWTDGAFDGYVCDLAVHPGYQKSGVGKGLLAQLAPAHPEVRWVLLAAPLAKDYYGRVGWEPLDNAWTLLRSGGAMPGYEAYQAEFADLAAEA
jgi:GNAT superfamily N-acetyltransferase